MGHKMYQKKVLKKKPWGTPSTDHAHFFTVRRFEIFKTWVICHVWALSRHTNIQGIDCGVILSPNGLFFEILTAPILPLIM